MEILQARKINVNLEVDTTYNGINLLATKFNTRNVDTYGKKLLSKLFTKAELAASQIERSDTQLTRFEELDPV